jgi:linoleoyl-CoA desaturase
VGAIRTELICHGQTMTMRVHAGWMNMAQIRFAHDPSFAATLRSRVDQYFSDHHIPKTANAAMVIKTVLLLSAAVSLYLVLVMAHLPWVAAVPLCVALGVGMALIGFNIGHDAIHGSYSDTPWINAVLSRVFDVSGASSFTWSTAHNFVHHTYTNVPGVDDDLEPGPLLLFYPRARPHWIFRFQHIYAFVLYAFTYVTWVFKKDFVQLRQPDPRSQRRAPLSMVVSVVLWKVVHVGLFVVIPMAVSGYAWPVVLVGYLITLMATGLTLATVFQLAHCLEEVAFPEVQQGHNGPHLDDAFHAHQLKTTANFAVSSRFWRFVSGGLNQQIEHHLFSKICHIHYPALMPIVRATAAEFGLPYHEHARFVDALASHVRAMRRFGRPAVVPMTTDLELPIAIAAE